MSTVAVVDYGMGNRRSVEKAFEHVGAEVRVTGDHDAIRDADAVVVPGVVGGFDHELLDEFLRGVAIGSRMTVHLTIEAGTNAHHMIEAAFKAFARALRQAVAIDPTETGVPSTKGTLT